jgi:hypothetical protein
MDELSWSMLFDSEAFVMVHVPFTRYVATGPLGILVPDTTGGYEIVDKRTNREVFVTGVPALAIAQKIAEWRDDAPDVPDVNAYLERWSHLGQLPLCTH